MWFRKEKKVQAAVCQKCRVLFKSYDYPVEYSELCPAHREEEVKLNKRRLEVQKWLNDNWKKYEEQYDEHVKEREAAYKEYAMMEQRQRQAAQQGQNTTGFGGARTIFGPGGIL